MTRLFAALQGDLKRIVEEERQAAEKAVTSGIRTATVGINDDLRGQVQKAGLGPRLAKTWRSKVFPPGEPSVNAAGIVWSKAPHILRAFAENTTIRSRSGRFLAIPTPAAPKRGVSGKRISPETWPAGRYGPLRFVPRRGGGGLLVAEGLQASYRRTGEFRGFRRASKRAQAAGSTASAVMFVLLPQVKLRKRLDVDAATNAWLNRTLGLILDAWES